LDHVTNRVSSEFGIDPEQVGVTTNIRSLLRPAGYCFIGRHESWASVPWIYQSGLVFPQPSVNISVMRGEKIAEAELIPVEDGEMQTVLK
jgi:hypothetical protein